MIQTFNFIPSFSLWIKSIEKAVLIYYFRVSKSIRQGERMLRFMRRHATGFLIKALFGVIIVVFIFWGVGSFREREKVVAEVGPYKIYYTEYADTYNRFLNIYKMLYKDSLDENILKSLKIKEKVMDELTDKYVMLINAKEMGIHVYDKELNDYITGMNAFKRDGRFSQKVYEEILRRHNLDPKRFEEGERASIIASRFINIITDNGVFMTDNDLWKAYIDEKGKIELSYAVFDPKDYTGKVNITDKEIEELYEKEKQSFKNENAYRLKYIVIDEKSGLKDDAVYMDLLKGGDMDAYARKNGLTVVDLGDIREGELLKRFGHLRAGDWIKDLKKGDVTLPIREGTRSYIFKLIDVEAGRPFDKATALNIIKDRIAKEKAKGYARALAEDAIAKKAFKEAKTTGFISRRSFSISGIGPIPQEHLGVFSLSEKNPVYNKPIEISGRYYIFSYRDEKLPDKKEWENEKEQFRRFLATKKGEELVKSLLLELKRKEKIKIHGPEV